jgi:hypothetical protein
MDTLLSDFKINIQRIAAKSFVLFDGDNKSKSTRLNEISGVDHGIVDGKEIENILPEEIIQYCTREIISASEIEESVKLSALEKISDIKYEQYSKSDEAIGRYLDGCLKLGFSSFDSGMQSVMNG